MEKKPKIKVRRVSSILDYVHELNNYNVGDIFIEPKGKAYVINENDDSRKYLSSINIGYNMHNLMKDLSNLLKKDVHFKNKFTDYIEDKIKSLSGTPREIADGIVSDLENWID